MKLTREQLQGRKDKAVRFTENVLDDPERASEIEDESLDDYADRRHIQLTNPSRRPRTMATRTTDQDRIAELEAENEALQDQLDAIQDIVAPDDDEDDSSDGDSDDSDSDDDDDSDGDDDSDPE